MQIEQNRESYTSEKQKLMHQFIELINTKKDRIQLLTDLLADRAPKCHCNAPKNVTKKIISNDDFVIERNASPQPSTSNARPKSPINTRVEVVKQDSEDLLNDEIDLIVLPKRAKVDLGLNKEMESSSTKTDEAGLTAPKKAQKSTFDINAYLDNME